MKLTVEQLIEKLKEYPKDAIVVDSKYLDIMELRLEEYDIQQHYKKFEGKTILVIN